MPGQTISAVDALLKDFYLDKIPEEIKNHNPMSEWFEERNDMPTDGRHVVYPAHVQRNSGRGAIAAGANLPQAGAQGWADFEIPYRYNYARIQIDAQSLKATKTSKGAFEKVFDAEIMGAARDCGRDRNRQLFGYGVGILGVVSATANNAVQTLKNAFNVSDANAQFNVPRFLVANDVLAGVKSDGSVVNWVGVVSSVNVSANTVTFTAPVNATAGDLIVRVSLPTSTSLGDSGYSNEVMGLLGMIDDGTYVGTYQNISRTTYPIMQSSVLDLGQGTLTVALLQKAFDLADQKSDGKINTLFMHHSTLEEHLSNLLTFKRYNDEFSMAPDAGWKEAARDGKIEFNEAPMNTDRDCPYGVIFGADESEFFRYVNEEFKWADEDGTILLRVAGVDAYEARGRVFDNFHNDTPNRCFRVQNIALSTVPTAVQLV